MTYIPTDDGDEERSIHDRDEDRYERDRDYDKRDIDSAKELPGQDKTPGPRNR